MRCAQCAVALLVYVATATVLELYWMRDRQLTAPSSVVTPGSSNTRWTIVPLPRQGPAVSPPPPPPPPPSHDPALQTRSVDISEAAFEAIRPVIANTARVNDGYSAVKTSSSNARTTAAHSGTPCWEVPRPFFEPPFDESFASVLWTKPLVRTRTRRLGPPMWLLCCSFGRQPDRSFSLVTRSHGHDVNWKQHVLSIDFVS